MKLRPNFILNRVCGENVILAEGVENIDFSKIISLNDTAAFLWEQALQGPFSDISLAQALVDNYEINEEVALRDVREILQIWKDEGLIDE